MTREQKIWRLNKYCSSHKCNQEGCRIYQECSDSAGELLESSYVSESDKLYNKLFGPSITDKLTGVITVKDELKKVIEERCVGYCVYGKMTPHFV